MTTVADALAMARAANVDRLDSQLLLGHVLSRSRAWLIAHDDARLDAAQALAWRTLLAKRVAGEPVAYLVGSKEFRGLTFRVEPGVLIPRPDTELLVDWALERLANGTFGTRNAQVADLGTGSGAIAISVQHAVMQAVTQSTNQAHRAASMLATDLSEAALSIARENAASIGVEVEFVASDWWQAFEGRHFDLVLSNPPYIAGGDPHLPALKHEPSLALTPGGDGLDALRRIVLGAPGHLRPGGWLLLEHGYDQADAVQALLRESGFEAIESRRDLGGQWRCSGGRLPGAMYPRAV